MKCKFTKSCKYKKSFLIWVWEKFCDFADWVTGGIDNENKLTDKEVEYLEEHFNDLPIFKKN